MIIIILAQWTIVGFAYLVPKIFEFADEGVAFFADAVDELHCVEPGLGVSVLLYSQHTACISAAL